MKKLQKLFLLLLLLGVAISTSAQTRTLKGKILSAQDNQPVAGASVRVKNKSIGTAATNDGSFSLNIPTGPVTLVISYIGYDQIEKNIDTNTSDVSISLNQNNNQLGEVVVTALGITRQAKTLVYATQSVKPSELTEVRDPNNVLNSLQGDRKSTV